MLFSDFLVHFSFAPRYFLICELRFIGFNLELRIGGLFNVLLDQLLCNRSFSIAAGGRSIVCRSVRPDNAA